jgi:phage tail-like protein
VSVHAPVPARHHDPLPDRAADRFGYGRGWLLGNLPVVMQEDDLLARYVTIIEEVASTVRYAVESSADAADVTVSAPSMVRYLGGWLGAPGLHEELPPIVQREITRATGAALMWRGTAHALTSMLEAITRGPVRVQDPGGVYRDGEAQSSRAPVVVDVESCGHLRPGELAEVVRAEVPAHVALVVRVAGEVVWPVGGTTPAERAVVS